MFALLQKKGHLQLENDTMLNLFDSIVSPIMLYGCELWGYSNIDVLERLHLRFCKILLKVKKSTPNAMVYGELGRHPLSVTIKSRMLCFWFKLIQEDRKNKYCSVMYQLMYNLHPSLGCSLWLKYIKSILDSVGLSDVWFTQGTNVQYEWFKAYVKRCLSDQSLQSWHSNIDNSNKCINYKIFKKELKFEDYLIHLPPSLRYSYSKFRCRNTKLPVETNTFYGNLGSDRCLLCPQDVVGDEFHYLFSCSYFGDERNLLLKPYYRVNPSTLKMEELFNESGGNKLNLCKLIKIIHERFKSLKL